MMPGLPFQMERTAARNSQQLAQWQAGCAVIMSADALVAPIRAQ
jgi:hypothetical protein